MVMGVAMVEASMGPGFGYENRKIENRHVPGLVMDVGQALMLPLLA